jgi:hypothetical protein
VATSNAQSAPLKLKQTIPLPGVEGRIDHFAADPSGQRLFVCALGNNSLEVIDPRKAKGSFHYRPRSPQGVAYIPTAIEYLSLMIEGGAESTTANLSKQPSEIDLKMMPITLATTVPPRRSMSASEAAVSLSLTRRTESRLVRSN